MLSTIGLVLKVRLLHARVLIPGGVLLFTTVHSPGESPVSHDFISRLASLETCAERHLRTHATKMRFEALSAEGDGTIASRPSWGVALVVFCSTLLVVILLLASSGRLAALGSTASGHAAPLCHCPAPPPCNATQPCVCVCNCTQAAAAAAVQPQEQCAEPSPCPAAPECPACAEPSPCPAAPECPACPQPSPCLAATTGPGLGLGAAAATVVGLSAPSYAAVLSSQQQQDQVRES